MENILFFWMAIFCLIAAVVLHLYDHSRDRLCEPVSWLLLSISSASFAFVICSEGWLFGLALTLILLVAEYFIMKIAEFVRTAADIKPPFFRR